eukprot:CCRYP_006171-RA/>CCRYP_006171-RA protein AED:0.34 eAED:0.34 QI:0/0.5/0.33/1/0.5/0.33/3/584/105
MSSSSSHFCAISQMRYTSIDYRPTDSLIQIIGERHSVEFWSGGFQLFGQCFLNRILSLDPTKFERQLIYHVSNNKQRTLKNQKFIRVGDFYGQIITVKERAETRN